MKSFYRAHLQDRGPIVVMAVVFIGMFAMTFAIRNAGYSY